MNFWKQFCIIAERKGVKPHKALMEMDISSGCAVNWKRGSMPNGETLIKISKYFNVSIDEMLGLKGIKGNELQ